VFKFNGPDLDSLYDEERKSDEEHHIIVSNLYQSEKDSCASSYDKISIDNVDSNGSF